MNSHRIGETTGVSPVVAVILLVAVTVTLSAVIGGFALNLGQSTTSGNTQQSIGVKTTGEGSNITATIVTGVADEARLLINGTEVDTISNASPGDSLSASNVHPDADVTVISVVDGDATVVSSTSAVTSETVSSTSSSNTPFAGSLIHHYKLDSGSGSTIVDSAGSANGTLKNGSWADTSRGAAIQLAGTGDSKVNETGLTNLSGPWTFSAWANGTIGHDNSMMLASNSNYALKFEQFDNTGNLGFTEYGVSDYTFSNAPTPTGEWAHIVFVNDGSQTLVYVNGTQLDTNTNTIPLPLKGFGAIHKGELDDIRVYNRSLNNSEVSKLYNETN